LIRTAVERFGLLIVSSPFRLLPRRGGLILARWLGVLAYWMAPGRRKIALKNLGIAYGEVKSSRERSSIARKSFQNLFMNLSECLHLLSSDKDTIEDAISFTGEEHLKEALSEGRGVLLVSAHIGNWELICPALAHKGYLTAMIIKLSRNETVNHYLVSYRERMGVRVLRRRNVLGDCLKCLRDGGIVAFVSDMNARRSEGVFVPFFGREACTLTSLALIARKTGAPVVPVYAYRKGYANHAVIGTKVSHETVADRGLDILERTRSYVSWSEDAIRQHPEQWMWMIDRWKTRPKKEWSH